MEISSPTENTKRPGQQELAAEGGGGGGGEGDSNMADNASEETNRRIK